MNITRDELIKMSDNELIRASDEIIDTVKKLGDNEQLDYLYCSYKDELERRGYRTYWYKPDGVISNKNVPAPNNITIAVKDVKNKVRKSIVVDKEIFQKWISFTKERSIPSFLIGQAFQHFMNDCNNGRIKLKYEETINKKPIKRHTKKVLEREENIYKPSKCNEKPITITSIDLEFDLLGDFSLYTYLQFRIGGFNYGIHLYDYTTTKTDNSIIYHIFDLDVDDKNTITEDVLKNITSLDVPIMDVDGRPTCIRVTFNCEDDNKEFSIDVPSSVIKGR